MLCMGLLLVLEFDYSRKDLEQSVPADIIVQGEYFYFIHSVQMMHQLLQVQIPIRIYAPFFC